MIRVADRHLALAALSGILLALTALLGMDAVFALIAELADLGKGEYSVGHAFYYVFLTLPRRAINLFPTAAVVGTLLGVGGLAASGELIAYRTAGLSRLRIAMAVVVAGCALMVPIVVLSEVVAPVGERLAHSMRVAAQSDGVAVASGAGIWIRDGDSIVHARRPLASSDGPGGPVRLADVDVFRFDQGQLVEAAHAEAGSYDAGVWTMDQVRRSNLGDDRVITEFSERESWKSLLDPALLEAAVARPQSLSTRELKAYVDYMESNGLEAQAYESALWSKLTYPVTTLVIMFAGMPFVFYGLRAGGFGSRLFVGMLLGVGFYYFNRSAGSVGEVYGLSPLLVSITPSVVFAAVTTWLLRRGL